LEFISQLQMAENRHIIDRNNRFEVH